MKEMKKINMKDIVFSLIVAISLVCLTIGMIFIVRKNNSSNDYETFKNYTYITAGGETFETKDIVKVESGPGQDRYSIITLKDGTVIFAEGYILRNELK